MNNQQDQSYVPEERLFSSDFYSRLIVDLKSEILAWRISFELGGLKYYIPNKVTENNLRNHFLARYGKEFFVWLVSNYGGTSIIFPSGPNNLYKRNKVQAEILARKGYSINEIARQIGFHYNSSRRAKKRVVLTQQTNLFQFFEQSSKEQIY